ncbi:10301_t:CDS:2, partial [Funneliformis geosporum]
DRFGNLVVIDDKYVVAISSACRVTFIVLNNLPTVDMRPMQTPENVPRLFDLVKPKDEKFIPAFYSVLQNTLVAENPQQAFRIAFGKTRWRVVTLNGELVGRSGIVSGGGPQVAMNSTYPSDITPEAITKLERVRNHLEVQWREVNEKVSSLVSQLQEKKDELPKLEFELSKLEICVDVCVKSITYNETRIIELRFVSGGNAKLECDGLDPYYDGVVFSVKPPNKSWRTISDLSGEEKIDAALDFRNVSIVANYIKERIRDAQFIVISLNDNMFELADHLVG